jgi:hypothetical protein
MLKNKNLNKNAGGCKNYFSQEIIVMPHILIFFSDIWVFLCILLPSLEIFCHRVLIL